MNCVPDFWTVTKYCLKHWKDAKGRARRSEFWFFYLAECAISSFFTIICMTIIFAKLSAAFAIGSTSTTSDPVDNIMVWMFWFGYLPMIILAIPFVFTMIRRLHDIGKSGWYIFLVFSPFVGPTLLLIWFLTDSDPNENRYGPSPKYDPKLADYYHS